MNETHSEIVEEPGTHEVAANIAMETEDGGIVRTFDFRIGTVELDENGNEVASSSADPPSIDSEEEVATGDSDDGLGTEVFVGIGFVGSLSCSWWDSTGGVAWDPKHTTRTSNQTDSTPWILLSDRSFREPHRR
jgi:hypothetical protein